MPPTPFSSVDDFVGATISGTDGDAVFKTFRIESRNGNKIGFETDLAQFQRAIKVHQSRSRSALLAERTSSKAITACLRRVF